MPSGNHKKNRFKPLFKQMLKLRINALHNFKILKLKKKKWKSFLTFFKSQLKTTKYKKYRVIDQDKYLINKKNKFELNFKSLHFKKLFIYSKISNLFFGKLAKSYYKTLINKTKNKIKNQIAIRNKKKVFIHFLESRLDFILLRSKFCPTIRSARQCISHGYVNVNNAIIKSKCFRVKSGDLIFLKYTSTAMQYSYKKNLAYSTTWPLSPNHLIVNYKTMEIIFLGNFIKETATVFYFPFYLKLHQSLSDS
jgi:ribosomal protein S4